jgi:hypothetical protein
MGSGEVGGNGSVQWTMVHEDVNENYVRKRLTCREGAPGGVDDEVAVALEAVGKDAIAFDDIGKKIGVPRHFKVTLRYACTADAAAAKANAVVKGNLLILFVQAIDRADGAVNEPKEIRIDW